VTDEPRDSRWFLRERVHAGLRPLGRQSAELPEGRPVNPLIKGRLQQALQARFAPILTPRRSCEALAAPLAALEAGDQQRVLEAVELVARSDLELAFAFAGRAPEALVLLEPADFDAWITELMSAFDCRGLGAGIAAVEALPEFARRRRARRRGVGFEEVAGTLRALVLGLGGRALELRSAEPVYTDTESVFLPALIDTLPAREDCLALYKAMTVYLWAQTWFGTWRPAVLERLASHPAGASAVPAFAALEHERLSACLARELPGVHQRLRRLQAVAEPPFRTSDAWRELAAPLAAADADALASCDRIAAALVTGLPAPACYQGEMRPGQVQAVLEARLARERARLQVALGKLAMEQAGAGAPDADQAPAWRNAGRRFTLAGAQAGRESRNVQLELDGAPLTLPGEVQGVLASIRQDLGEVPQDYLAAAGSRDYAAGGADAPPTPEYQALFDEAGAYRYPEWDHSRGRFRPDYCTLRESEVEPVYDRFPEQTLARYGAGLKSIRRSFEALITEARVERRQRHGDDIDLDAVVEARADLAVGHELPAGLYTQLRDHERSLAALFMVDMSGSTKGWVNEAERESLLLLCEALDKLQDRYAIYGFSGRTHKRCEVYRIKRFDEPYGEVVRGRISGIRPKGYTRMGAAIRHLTGILAGEPARTRLLVTLSDGKPEDYRSYRGRYGIEDTRHALLEGRLAGVHAFCITIDKDAGDYLPHMYGPANYALVDDVARLPVKVADIYRKLTS